MHPQATRSQRRNAVIDMKRRTLLSVKSSQASLKVDLVKLDKLSEVTFIPCYVIWMRLLAIKSLIVELQIILP